MEWLARKAQRVVALSGPPPSPCISVCRIEHVHGWCAGCLRTLDEIAAWSTMEAEGKRAVWALIAQRAQACEPPPLPSNKSETP